MLHFAAKLSLLMYTFSVSEDKSVIVNVVINRAAFPDPSSLRIVGWETNERFDSKQITKNQNLFNSKMLSRLKPGPRVADLSSVLSSEILMAQAVDLNLRLMKWRMWTDLDLEKLKRTRWFSISLTQQQSIFYNKNNNCLASM